MGEAKMRDANDCDQEKTLGMCGREKCWKELGLEEKAERMRQVVKGQEHTIKFLSDQVSRLGQHQHKDGHIVVPLKEQRGCREVTPVMVSKEEVWF